MYATLGIVKGQGEKTRVITRNRESVYNVCAGMRTFTLQELNTDGKHNYGNVGTEDNAHRV